MFASWPYAEAYKRRIATRENYFCVWCRRPHRMRMLAHAASGFTDGDVYQAGGWTTYTGPRVPRSLVVSEYVEGVEPGSVVDGVRREDLQALTFEDSSFDLVLTSEVFEHVADPWKAFSEVRRVLRLGGHHIFTVPDMGRGLTRARAGLPDVFHMDGPDRRSRVVTDFGDDLPDLLRRHGFETTGYIYPGMIVYVTRAVSRKPTPSIR